MDTVGSILDKIIILEKRMQVLRSSDNIDFSVVDNLSHQRRWLLYGLGNVLVEIAKGKHPAIFNKHKQYDKDVTSSVDDDFKGFAELITELIRYNHMLWDLEDIRRDTTISDEERLEAADKVSVYNKKRNNTIDLIDSIVTDVRGLLK